MSTLLRPHRILAILLAVVPFTLNAATITSTLDAFISNPDGSWTDQKGQEQHGSYGYNRTVDGRGGLNSFANAFAETTVDIGSLKVWAWGNTGNSVGSGQQAYAQAQASISYQDSIKFASISNRVGTTALAKFKFFVPGSTNVTNTYGFTGNEAVANFTFDATVFDDHGSESIHHTDTKTNFNFPTNNTPDTFPFPISREITLSSWITIGSDTYLALNMLASGWSNTVAGNSSFSSDYSHSLYFGGIDSLTLADGTQITDFTATGEDGMDYKKSYVPTTSPSVPDTSSTLVSCLMALGGISLVKLRRRAA